jgi:beta-lactamase regulating signal transducer with metallopeptidase domain
MDGWTIGLWVVGGLIAVAALAKIMTARRNQVLQEWQAKVAAEKRQKKSQ